MNDANEPAMQTLFLTTDQLEIEMYNLARKYHGLIEDVATDIGGRAAALRQALNPFYAERPSFVTRTALVFSAWLRLRPRSGIAALYAFVLCILHHAPNGNVQEQVRVVERHVLKVKTGIDAVQNAIDEIPLIRLECRELVRVHKPRATGEKKRRTVKRLKQPSIL